MATPRPDDMQFFAPRPGTEFKLLSPLEKGQAFAYGEQGGQQTGVATNVLSSAQSQALGFQAPRPTGDPANILNVPRPSINTGPALSERQQAFLAGDRQIQPSSPLATQQMARASQLKAERDAKETKDRAFALSLQTEPERIRGEAMKATEESRITGRMALEETKGAIREKLQDKSIGSKERIATLGLALQQAEGELDRAQKSGDTQAKIQAEKDIATLNNSARLQALREQGQFDVQSETNKFVNEAKLQAQREGTDVQMALLKAVTDPLVDEELKAAIIRQGTDNLVKMPEPVAQTAQPTEQPAQAEGEGAALDGNPKTYTEAEQDYDRMKKALDAETNEGRRLAISEAMKRAKQMILKPAI